FEQLFDAFHRRLIENQFAIKQLSYALDRKIIGSRPQSAGSQNYVGTGQSQGQTLLDAILVVSDGGMPVAVNADVSQLCRQILSIGVHYLPEQQLGANRNDFSSQRRGLHGVTLSGTA